MITDRRQRIIIVKPDHNVPTKYHSPPLGPLYLASTLREKAAAEVCIIHIPVEEGKYNVLEKKLSDFKPDWVGISALSFESKGLYKTAEIVKKICGNIPVIAGGPHPSFYTIEVMSNPNIDFAVIGEGEITATEIATAIQNGKPLEGIEGIAWRSNGEIKINPRTNYIENLDSLPFPAWDLIDLEKYRHYDRMSRIGSGKYTGILTSRSCPYKCIYCHNLFGKKFRKRSPENVLEEIKILHDKYGVRELEVIDDCFNLDLKRAKKIFDLIIDSGMKLYLMFPNGVRGDNLDEEFISKARKAGVRYMSIAIETASPRLQKLIRKNLDLQKTIRNIELTDKYGIMTLGFFMLGFPTETREELKKTIDFAVHSKLHAANFFAVQPYEGTELGEIAKSMGRKVVQDFDQMYMTSDFVNLTEMSDDELRSARKRAVLRFYLSPSRIWRIARDYPQKWRLFHLLGVLIKRIMLKR